MQTQREREDKYDVGLDFTLPTLTDFVPTGGRCQEMTLHLDNVYYDTADHSLLAVRAVLRRREGDADTGWQLKLPDGDARTEIRTGLGDSDAVPEELAEVIRGAIHGSTLGPVAVLRTERHVHRIFDDGDDLLAEVADDTVHATVPGKEAVLGTWREIEVELGLGSEEFLDDIGNQLRTAGATPAARSSKLERALAPLLELQGYGVGDVDESSTGIVTGYLAAQIAAIVTGDIRFRRGGEPVHDTRVAIRRLRSTLRTFKKLFPRDLAADLSEELSWYADLLGHMRDPQVQRARLTTAVSALPPELVLGPVAAGIGRRLARDYADGRRAVIDALNGERYRALIDALATWRTDPPFADNTDAMTLAPYVARAQRKARKRLRNAVRSDDDVRSYHRARKAAKRARYAAELATPELGKKVAKRKIKKHKRIQRILGEHQDSVVAADLLRTLGADTAHTAGENGFTFGLLYAQEQAAAARARDKVR